MSRTLAKAFTESPVSRSSTTSFRKADVVEKLQTQMQSGKNVYEAGSYDSDLIGTTSTARPSCVGLYDRAKARRSTIPADSTTSSAIFTTEPDESLYQLPDKQFANLYGPLRLVLTIRNTGQVSRPRMGYELGVRELVGL